MPFAKRGAVGTFGGRLSRGADTAALKVAEDAERQGFSPEDIWKSTGWGRGADGKWRFEVSDFGAGFTDEFSQRFVQSGRDPTVPASFTMGIGSAFDQPNVYSHFPKIADYPLDAQRHPNVSGQYRRNPPSIYLDAPDLRSARSAFLHEQQHFIAERPEQQFARGYNPQAFETVIPEQIERMRRIYGSRIDPIYEELATRAKQGEAIQLYKSVAGEVEARNVERRSMMTIRERSENPPWTTEDIPRANQLVIFENNIYRARAVDYDPFSTNKLGGK